MKDIFKLSLDSFRVSSYPGEGGDGIFVTGLNKGRFVAVMTFSNKSRKCTNTAQIFLNNGEKVGEEFCISDENNITDLFALTTGEFAVIYTGAVWIGTGDDLQDIYAYGKIYDNNGTNVAALLSGDAIIPNNVYATELINGNIAFVYPNDSGGRNIATNTNTGELVISSQPFIDYDGALLAITGLSTGEIAYSYLGGEYTQSLVVGVYNFNGSNVEKIYYNNVVSQGEYQPIASLPDGKFATLFGVDHFLGDGKVYFSGQIFNKYAANTTDAFIIDGGSHFGDYYGISSSPYSNNLAVTWMCENDICIETYDEKGNIVNGKYKITGTSGESEHDDSQVSGLSDGNNIVVWRGWEDDSIGYYYGCIFETGTSVGCTTLLALASEATNHRDLALLSLKVYDDPKDADISLPSGWKEAASSSDSGVLTKPAEGYFGRLYIKGDTAIVAERGTEFKHLSDWEADSQLFFNKVSSQFSPAEEFFNYIKSYICQNLPDVKYLAFTGHSLGAALAGMSSAKHHFPAVIFESPGVKTILADNPDTFSQEDADYAQSNVVIYNTSPNLIDTMAPHAGSVKRLFPSVDTLEMKLGELPFVGYVAYTIFQHSINGIVNLFNKETSLPVVSGLESPWPSGTVVGYNGYDNFKAFDTNTYYWTSYVDSIFGDNYLSRWLTNAGEFLDHLTLSYPAKGVNITSDNSGNKIWGTTNFDDIIVSGTGDDIHYLFKGNDLVTDSGGKNTYKNPLGIQGNNIINDHDKTGEIHVFDSKIAGEVYKVSTSKCTGLATGSTYFLAMGSKGSYYFIESGNDLIITPDCATSENELLNSIRLQNFSWGNFGINKYVPNDVAVVAGSKLSDLLTCPNSNNIKNCVISTFEGDDITQVSLGRDISVYGYKIGKKIIQFLDNGLKEGEHSSNVLLNMFYQSSSNTVSVYGIKEGDVIYLSAIARHTTNLVLGQNGTHLNVKLGEGNYLVSEIMLGAPFVDFSFNNGNIIVKNKNMTEVLFERGFGLVNGSIVNATDSPSAGGVNNLVPDNHAGSSNIGLWAGISSAIVFLGVAATTFWAYKTGKLAGCLGQDAAEGGYVAMDEC